MHRESSHESCEVFSGSNSQLPTHRHFCLLKLTKYLKNLAIRMNISNTNAYFFLIAYTCINYKPPMNPLKLFRIKFKRVDFSSFLFAQIDKIFENFVRPDKYLQHQLILVSDTLHMYKLQSPHESCEVFCKDQI